jgi:hypothetical protein
MWWVLAEPGASRSKPADSGAGFSFRDLKKRLTTIVNNCKLFY